MREEEDKAKTRSEVLLYKMQRKMVDKRSKKKKGGEINGDGIDYIFLAAIDIIADFIVGGL